MKNLFVNTAVVTGVCTGVAIWTFTLAIHAFGLNPLGRHALLFLPVYAMGLILGFRYYRDYRNGGFLGGVPAISMGIIINLATSATFGLLLYAWLKLASPALLITHQAAIREKLMTDKELIIKDPDYGPKYLADSLAAIPTISAELAAWEDFKKLSGVGLVMGIAIGLLFRKKQV